MKKIIPSFWKPGVPAPAPVETNPGRAKPLTVVYITSRPEPQVHWFIDSLERQIHDFEHVEIIVVDSLVGRTNAHWCTHEYYGRWKKFKSLKTVEPKPTIWQGPSRITKEDWWAASNARNTGIALCKTEWIAFCDDRCVLMPAWMKAVREAMAGNYAVCGSYEKRVNMTVENGAIINGGIVTGADNRIQARERYPKTVDGGWWYGCTNALPLEWALNVNGFAEDKCDGLSFEDIPFGMTLANNGWPIKFDARMMIVEDRSPEHLGTVMKRSDYGVSPKDKSHAVLDYFRTAKTSGNSYNLRELRDKVLRGEPFPPPTASHFEWFTGRPIESL